jgi:hypothetical protein
MDNSTDDVTVLSNQRGIDGATGPQRRKITTAMSDVIKPKRSLTPKKQYSRDSTCDDTNQVSTTSNSSDAGEYPDVAYVGTSNEAPNFMRRNWILKGYRINFDFRGIPKTLFMVHNETTNIWSHLLGFMIFASLFIFILFFTAPDGAAENYAELMKGSTFGIPNTWVLSVNKFIAKHICWVEMDIEGTPEIFKFPLIFHM